MNELKIPRHVVPWEITVALGTKNVGDFFSLIFISFRRLRGFYLRYIIYPRGIKKKKRPRQCSR